MKRFNHVSLIYNRPSQQLEFYPPDAEMIYDGAPTAAASYSVWRGTQSTDEAAVLTGTATLDSLTPSITATSGYGQADRTKITLTSTSGIVLGRRYLLETGETVQRREVVIPVQVTSSTVAYLQDALSYDYTTLGGLKNLRQYFTADTTFIQTRSNINVWGALSSGIRDVATDEGGQYGSAAPPYRLRWTYSTGGTTRETWSTFDVVRKPAKANLGLEDLKSLIPDASFLELAPQRGQGWAQQLVRAEDDVALAARAAGYDPDAINDPQVYDRIVLARWAFQVGQSLWLSSNRKPTWQDEVKQQYDQTFAQFVGVALRAWVDLGTSGATHVNPAQQLFLRR